MCWGRLEIFNVFPQAHATFSLRFRPWKSTDSRCRRIYFRLLEIRAEHEENTHLNVRTGSSVGGAEDDDATGWETSALGSMFSLPVSIKWNADGPVDVLSSLR